MHYVMYYAKNLMGSSRPVLIYYNSGLLFNNNKTTETRFATEFCASIIFDANFKLPVYCDFFFLPFYFSAVPDLYSEFV
jgi:hypothetical protein